VPPDALRVDMDSLAVADHLGEPVDAVLTDLGPVADPEVLVGQKIVYPGEARAYSQHFRYRGRLASARMSKP